MSRKELPLSVVDVESHESPDWERDPIISEDKGIRDIPRWDFCAGDPAMENGIDALWRYNESATLSTLFSLSGLNG
jgi:hypothetical protein